MNTTRDNATANSQANPPTGSPDRSSRGTNYLFTGIHLLLLGLVALPPVSVAAFSPAGDIGAPWNVLLWLLSAGLLAGGAAGFAIGWMTVQRRRAVLAGTILLIAFYGLAVVLFDTVLGAVVSLNVSGQTGAPKADIYGWAIEPNHEITIVHPDTLEATVERVNSQGWRDVEHEREKTRPRVLLLGDSQVFGHGNTLENTIGRQLQHQLGEAIEVISMGNGGYGTDQEYLVLKNEGLDWHPDYVVLVFTVGNDFMDSMHDISFMGTAPKPSFELRDGVLVQRPFEPLKTTWLRTFFNRSNISRVVRAMLQARTVRENPQGLRVPGGHEGDRVQIVAENLNELDDFENDYSGYAILKPREQWSPKLEAGWEVTTALLRAMNEACREAGAVFILYPNQQLPEDYVYEFVSKGKTYALEAQGPFRMLAEFAAEEGIPFIEEPEEMKQRMAKGELSFENDGHYNEVGTKAAAEQIAIKIKQLMHPQGEEPSE
ncbi:MAG: hypothetical protein PWP23_3262 [Candidatus Sumerlaeota bacterium]|nr:hypothetical protein [Candidatus Sumerlaeota bacterium]